MKPWQRGGLGPLGAVMPLGGGVSGGGKGIKVSCVNMVQTVGFHKGWEFD